MTENSEQWREDFPIEWGADHYVTRREFTKFMVLASGAAFAGNGFFVAKKFAGGELDLPARSVAQVADLAPGEASLFRYPTANDPAILLRLADERGEPRFAAYLQRCTHLTCPVQFAAHSGRLECPCHNGSFDGATGAVLSGPPPRPLVRIRLRVENGEIFAEGIEMGGRGGESA